MKLAEEDCDSRLIATDSTSLRHPLSISSRLTRHCSASISRCSCRNVLCGMRTIPPWAAAAAAAATDTASPTNMKRRRRTLAPCASSHSDSCEKPTAHKPTHARMPQKTSSESGVATSAGDHDVTHCSPKLRTFSTLVSSAKRLSSSSACFWQPRCLVESSKRNLGTARRD